MSSAPHIAFDSSVLTYFLGGNNGDYSMRPGDPLAEQRIAAVRLFLHAQPFIVPTVRAEAAEIIDPVKLAEHIGAIDWSFGETVPDAWQQQRIDRRAQELGRYHPGANECRIVAEIEQDGDIPVLGTLDGDLREHLSPHARIRIQTPRHRWDRFRVLRGTPPPRPASTRPSAGERDVLALVAARLD